MYLDELPILERQLGYGSLGLHGSLGYEGSRVVVGGDCVNRAVSAHGPSCVRFELRRRFASFRSRVAINDDVLPQRSYADFTVVADGRVLGAMPNVGAGDPPRAIAADVTGVAELTLLVDSDHFEHCHSVWIDPEVSTDGLSVESPLSDALRRAEVDVIQTLPRAERSIATVVSPAYAHLLDDMLGSLAANGHCDDVMKVVFSVEADQQCRQVIARHAATEIPCRLRGALSTTCKAILYSVARFVDARQYLCMDADTLILGDLRPVFDAISACPGRSVLVCRDAFLNQDTLERELYMHYGGGAGDLTLLLGRTFDEGSYPLITNDGVFAGSRGAMLALDNLIRHLPGVVSWVDARQDAVRRNQFVFNLALARMKCGVELDPVWNMQMHMCDPDVSRTQDGMSAVWRGRPVRVLHFCGWGRNRYPEYRSVAR